jgi:ubiquinone/menaquinone biosynthesis C-methylase UbiE
MATSSSSSSSSLSGGAAVLFTPKKKEIKSRNETAKPSIYPGRRRSSTPSRRIVIGFSSSGDDDENVRTSSSSSSSSFVKLTCPICTRRVLEEKNKDVCCGKTWTIERKNAYEYIDLEISRNANSFREAKLSGTSLFETPIVSNAYERGWRDSFAWAGFPGKEKEFDVAMRFVKENTNQRQPQNQKQLGEVVLDVSCGSGLFARKFADSKAFARVVASDFSENMLIEASQFAREENIDATVITFVRADVGRLPFETGSVDVVHAGAALHCWPSPTQAMAEISRVLKPGGTFVASTFLDPSANLNNDDLTKPFSDFFRDAKLGTGGAFNRFWTEQELKDLCQMVGLEDFKRERERQYILFAVIKNSVRCEDDDEVEECDIVLSMDEEGQ